jgi:hypothetical protein
MTHAVRGLGFAATFALVYTFAFVPQARAQSTAAYVYVQVQGPAGPVYGYSASSGGQLSPISSSPFKPGTAIVGGNGSKFFTLGHTLLHSWAVGSNGAIGSQLSDIGFMGYTGGSCAGTQDGDVTGVLDHTGKYIYLVLQNYEKTQTSDTCQTYQSYIINSGGSFSFDGATEYNSLGNTSVGLPSILGDESYAYANNYVFGTNDLLAFRRQNSGTLENISYDETDPTMNGGTYTPYYPDASPAGDFLVVQLYPNNNTSAPPQLGSYTVDSQGNIASTNTQSNMPTSALIRPRSTFSPNGAMLALYADNGASNAGSGIEIYRFNGSAPLALYENLLSGTPIDDVAWDTSNHLYAISKAKNMLYVFAVTTTSANLVSTTSLGTPASMVIVSQTASSGSSGCPAPEGQGINVCAPITGSTVGSSVQIDAAANVSGGVYRFELWNGSTKLLTVRDSGVMDQTISLAPGSYRLTFVAYNSAGYHVYSKSDFTVQ